ncbi:AGAP003439-PF [Anopheles gambiae str. PEST]|uniref:AGAP003439-PF n=1 Tax=Anopheles gambiae TaxID=7165 RepID=Q7QDI0_ANOGA|nr:AGAP003439-PF [Anopheles gambiae str. PEST]CAE54344.1 TPA: Mod(mdg4)-h67.2c [Anopheles gambiae]
MADDEQFSLCWNNFNSNLSAGFHESLQRGDLVDVTLAAEGHLVKAHRLILSVCSPYFRKMFTQVPVNQHAFIFLKDVSHSALQDLIQFMYCGEVNVKQDALPAFISTAEALQIKGLTETGDSAPTHQSPAKEEPAAAAAVPVTTATISTATIPASPASQRAKVQRNRIQSYKLESEESGDDKVVHIQATTSHHVSAQSNLSSQKRTMPQRGLQSHASKRTKMSISASSDGLDTSDSTPAQVQTVQTVQIVKQIPAQVIEPEYIELPIESINPKAEPDYTDETAEIETVDAETEQEQKLSEHDQGDADDDGNYVEDDTYGDMAMGKYEESYLTEGEEGAKPGVSGFVDSYTSDGGNATEISTQENYVMLLTLMSYSFFRFAFSTAINRMLANTFSPPKESPSKQSQDSPRSSTMPAIANAPSGVKKHSTPISTNCRTISPKQSSKPVVNFAEITKTKPVEMSILPTRKGAAGVLCQGHHFEFRYTRQHHKVYRCAWHSTHSCQAQVLLHNKLFYIIHDKHTHSESSKLHPDILGKTTLKTNN